MLKKREILEICECISENAAPQESNSDFTETEKRVINIFRNGILCGLYIASGVEFKKKWGNAFIGEKTNSLIKKIHVRNRAIS